MVLGFAEVNGEEGELWGGGGFIRHLVSRLPHECNLFWILLQLVFKLK